MEDRDLRRNEDTVMTDEEIMKKIRQDMDDIDVPDSISPLRMRQKLKSVKPDRKLVKFNRHRINVAGRVVAACFVGVVAIGAGTVAFVENQNANKMAETASVTAADSGAACDDCAESEEDALAEGLDTIGSLTRASSYDEIFDKCYDDSIRTESLYGGIKDGMGIVMEEAADDDMETESVDLNDASNQVTSMGTSNEAEKSEGYHSDTILQYEGVEEGDSIKTDGKYIYVLKPSLNKLFIIDSDNMLQQAVIDYQDYQSSREKNEYTSVREFYLKDGKLYIVYERKTGKLVDVINPVYKDLAEVDYADEQTNVSDVERYTRRYTNTTHVDVYDVFNASTPTKVNSFNQKGCYNTSRMVDDRFYLMTNEMSYDYLICTDKDYAIKEENLDEWLPTVNDCVVEPKDIYYVDGSRGYQCISSFDINTYSTIDTKVIYDSFAQFYMTSNNLYVYENKWEDDIHYLEDYSYDGSYDNYYKVSTQITKFNISGGEIVATAHNTFNGAISDTFAIRENGDYLYIVLDIDETHYKDSWEPVTRKDWTDVYVTDKNLKILGGLSKIAPGEQVYAARFIGDIGYFVTYRNMDPLFTVDLSNPYNPQLIGELEIPGFSNYLHPWGDHNLVGVGEERDEESNFIGIKISLYDTTDPTNVVEVDKLVLDADETSAQYNYKELLCDYNIGLAGFSALSYNWNDDDFDWENDEYKNEQFGYVFKIADNHIIEDAKILLNEGDDYYSWGASRMLYMNDCLYVTDDHSIRKLDVNNGYDELARFSFPQIDHVWESYPIIMDDVFLVD